MKLLHSVIAVVAIVCTSSAVSAQRCSVTPYGQGCGPVATGSVTPNGNTDRFDFRVTTTPRSRVLVVVGVNAIAVPLPTTQCVLLTEPAFVQQHLTDTAGVYSFSHAISGGGSFRGSARVQFLRLDFDAQNNLSIVPSNGLFMDCSGN